MALAEEGEMFLNRLSVQFLLLHMVSADQRARDVCPPSGVTVFIILILTPGHQGAGP